VNRFGGSGRTPTPIPDTEADTGRIDQRMVMFAKLAHTFDHFTPSDATRFIELAEAMVDMSPTDRATIYDLVSRLSK
jgi:hypothetical protein